MAMAMAMAIARPLVVPPHLPLAEIGRRDRWTQRVSSPDGCCKHQPPMEGSELETG